MGRANGDTGVGALGAHSEGGLRHDGGGRHDDKKSRHGHRDAGRERRVRHLVKRFFLDYSPELSRSVLP